MAESFGARMARLKRARRQQIADEHGAGSADVLSSEHEVYEPSGRPVATRPDQRRCISCFEDKAIGEYVMWDEHGGSHVANRCSWCRRHPQTPPLANVMELPAQRRSGVW